MNHLNNFERKGVEWQFQARWWWYRISHGSLYRSVSDCSKNGLYPLDYGRIKRQDLLIPVILMSWVFSCPGIRRVPLISGEGPAAGTE
jgi:hypothetical protein